MIKLIIDQKDKKRFQELFTFFTENHCEITLFPEGLKFRNENCQGIISKNAFFGYSITKTKPLGRINIDKKILKQFFEKWQVLKDKKGLIEIPIS